MDGTLIEAWASMKSFRPQDNPPPPAGGAGRNPEVDFHGERRLNQTHASTTDPEARLYRKGKGKEAKLCFMGHVLMENRHGLIISPRLTTATGTAERETAVEMVSEIPGRHRITVGATKVTTPENLSNLCVPLRPCRTWPKAVRAVPPPSMAVLPDMPVTPAVNACGNGWKKSSAG